MPSNIRLNSNGAVPCTTLSKPSQTTKLKDLSSRTDKITRDYFELCKSHETLNDSVLMNRVMILSKEEADVGDAIKLLHETDSDVQISAQTLLQKLRAPVAPPLQKAPLGLKNQGSNCWVNSLFQMIYSDLTLKSWLLSTDCPKPLLDFQTFIQSYDKASEKGASSATPDSQNLRLCLAKLTKNIAVSSSRQEDPTEAWMAIHELMPKNFRAQAEETRHYTAMQNEPAIAPSDKFHTREVEPHLALGIVGKTPSLTSLMESHCNSQQTYKDRNLSTESGSVHRHAEVQVQEMLTLTSAPPTLRIELKRFDANGKKISTPVKVPHTYTTKLKDNTVVNYDLNAFLIHIGESRDSGHYISLRKEQDGQWYKMNDNHVEKVRSSDMPKYLEQVYFAQYTKSE